MRQRGFEIAKGWEDKGINLPKRSTKNGKTAKKNRVL